MAIPDLGEVVGRFDATYDAYVHSDHTYKVRRRVVADRRLIYLEYGLFRESGSDPEARVFDARETQNSFVVCKGRWRPTGNDFHGIIEAFPKDGLTFVEADIGIGEGTAKVPLEMEKLCYALAWKALQANGVRHCRLEEETQKELERLGILNWAVKR